MTKVPLTFTANEDGSSVSLVCYDTTANDWVGGLVDSWCKLDYSMDGTTWNTYIDPDSENEELHRGKDINLKKGETVYFKATLGKVKENPNLNGFGYYDENEEYVAKYHHFIMEGSIKANGNIQFLLENTGTEMDVPKCCYSYMFKDCTSLTQAPELPAMTLDIWCYASMFSGCTSLTQAPELPATTLASRCYASMFKDCTNIPEPKYNMSHMTFDEVATKIQNTKIFGQEGTYEVQCSDKILIATFDEDKWEWTIS
jgi:hypothetical protein